jgi:hypothetical protein
MKTKQKLKEVTIKKNGEVSKKHNPKKKKTQEEQERSDRKLAGLNGLDEIYCG